ncbi:hypothetical protein GCM10023210_10070 [Chryseobacterium ginsengisoli]|uniref:HTH araC/xylS-type domain-containing protein n=1 Tax=Chryseobacterium ginsengisoli TaxID=363853 RepID=A0ABP9LX76_9FLAO
MQKQKNNEALKLIYEANNHAEKIGSKKGILDSNLLLMSIYSNISDYKNVIEIANKTENIAKEEQRFDAMSIIHMLRGKVYKNTGFLDESLKELKKGIFYANKIDDQDKKHFQLSRIYQNISSYYERQNINDSVIYFLEKKNLPELKLIKGNTSDDKLQRDDNIIRAYINIANYYMGLSDPPKFDLAEKYLNQIQVYKESSSYISNNDLIAQAFARLYYVKKDYKNSAHYYEEALKFGNQSKDPKLRREAYGELAVIYGKLGNKNLQLKYLSLSRFLEKDLVEKQESDFKNSAKQITLAKDKEYHGDIKKIWIRVICCFVILFIIFIVFWIRYVKKTKGRYETIINSFKENINVPIPPAEEQTSLQKEINIEKNKNIEITESTVKSILVFLDDFEKTNEFTKSDVNLSYLANYANTNTKYLNEVLKNYKGKSFSKYINGLRINYIMKLLYLEPKYREYKISYLAELCGFSSREVFSSVFKKETDITTSYYINQLKNEPETVVKNFN